MAHTATTPRDFVIGRVSPALEALEDNVRHLRRALVQTRHAAEDAATDAVLQVRRHPLGAVGTATALGLVAGVAAGFLIGRGSAARS